MRTDLIELAQTASDAPTFERLVLQELDLDIGFEAAFLAIKCHPSTTANIDAKKLDRAIARGDYALDIEPVRTAALSARNVAVDTTVLGQRQVQRSGYHRDFGAPMGALHTLFGFLHARGRPIGALMLGRTRTGFSAREIARVEALLPRLAIARLSYLAPWSGGPLAMPARSGAARVADFFRGQRVLESVDGAAGQQLVVRDRERHREMVFVDGERELVWSRASLADPERSGWFYIDLLHLAAARARHQRRVLFIGCGGGVAIRQFARVYPGVQIDLVESDARVIELARRWFALGDVPQLSVAIDDGAAFVARAPAETWDAILVDAYDGTELSAPFTEQRFFSRARRALRPGGGLAFNVIGTLDGCGDVRRVESAFRAELDDVRLVPVLDPGEEYSPLSQRNVVVLGSRN